MPASDRHVCQCKLCQTCTWSWDVPSPDLITFLLHPSFSISLLARPSALLFPGPCMTEAHQPISFQIGPGIFTLLILETSLADLSCALVHSALCPALFPIFLPCSVEHAFYRPLSIEHSTSVSCLSHAANLQILLLQSACIHMLD